MGVLQFFSMMNDKAREETLCVETGEAERARRQEDPFCYTREPDIALCV